MKPVTRPRWRSCAACFSLFAASRSCSWRFCCSRLCLSASLRARSAARRSARLGFGASGVSSSASAAPARHAGFDRLDLGDVAGHRYLGVVLGGRVVAGRAPALALVLRLAGAPFCLALSAGLCHQPVGPVPPEPSTGLLVGSVPLAPAAELAQLDPIGLLRLDLLVW